MSIIHVKEINIIITRMPLKPVIFTLLFIFPFLCGCKDSKKNQTGLQNEPVYKDVTVQEAYALINDNKGNGNFIILDVRTPQEYASDHLEDAINIDYNLQSFQKIHWLTLIKVLHTFCIVGLETGVQKHLKYLIALV